ncbi:MAG: hypothetical protein Q9227_005921 [Pyrenula ochraceoflavens]
MPFQPSSLLSRLAAESGFITTLHSPRDTKLLCLQRFVRLYAYGASFLILVHFLSTLGFSDERVGAFMTLTLLGHVAISFVLTLVTDQVGRRLVLAVGSGFMVVGGLLFCVSRSYWLLVLSSIVGIITPSDEIGPFRAVEASILAQLTEKEKRSDIFAWYTLFGTAGAALGSLTCGWIVQVLQDTQRWDIPSIYRIIFVLYSVLGMIKLVLCIMLSPAVELPRSETQYEEVSHELENTGLLSEDLGDEDKPHSSSKPQRHPPEDPDVPTKPTLLERLKSLLPSISPRSCSVVVRLLFLFGLDSIASGLAAPSWLTYYFTIFHRLSPSALGTLFLVANLLATVSNLFALPLAHRLGPLKTMVLTHLPSAICLALIPLPPATKAGTWLAVTFLALRACTQTIDQAPRQAFIADSVLPGERTAVLGLVNQIRSLAQAGGIGAAGWLAGGGSWIIMFSGAGGIKAVYDLLLALMFWKAKWREEQGKEPEPVDEVPEEGAGK